MPENNDLKDFATPNGDEVNPQSPTGLLDDESCPKREFVRTSIPPDQALAGTLKSDNNESTSFEPALNGKHDEPQPLGGFTMSPLDLTPDVTKRENDENSSRLDPRKMTVAVALAVGQTETGAAQLAGVHRTTVYRWLQDAAFVAEVNRQKREFVAEQRARLHTLLHLATTTLESFLERKDGDALKLKAATFILERFAPQLHEAIGPITEQAVEKAWKKGLG